MAPKPDRLTFVFGMVLAMAVTLIAITTWAAPRDESAASISLSGVIYRPQHLSLY